ncbi:MAG TPA: aldehyde dehydrogenase family protein, partial [Luteibaculaceae bacterium]|nr:aldehyde dehydrogenase family protein [Luteibaculaceae bacterium]
NVPGCSMLLEAVFQQSSRLGKVYNALYTDSKTTLKIIQKPEIRGVSFTGSTETGRIIAKKCGGALKPIVMELGGSNAFLVFEDSDLEFSAKMAVSSRFANNGQSCIASKRFIVDSRIHDEFRNLVAIEMMRIQVGDPSDESVSLGPLAREDLAAKVEKQVAKSVQKGAKIMMGGTRDFCLFSPTLLSDVKPGMPCFDEEVFGPVVSIIPADTEDEMIRLANATDFGLGVVLLSGDPDRLRNRIPEFMDGAVFVNTPVKSDARLPFGGSKNSGIGRELGEEGLRSFTNVKTTVIEKQP